MIAFVVMWIALHQTPNARDYAVVGHSGIIQVGGPREYPAIQQQTPPSGSGIQPSTMAALFLYVNATPASTLIPKCSNLQSVAEHSAGRSTSLR